MRKIQKLVNSMEIISLLGSISMNYAKLLHFHLELHTGNDSFITEGVYMVIVSICEFVT